MGENKNKYMMAFASLLVYHGWFECVQIFFLPTGSHYNSCFDSFSHLTSLSLLKQLGHTHIQIDSLFGRLSSASSRVTTLTPQEVLICQPFHSFPQKEQRPTIVVLSDLYAWRDFLGELCIADLHGLAEPHIFLICMPWALPKYTNNNALLTLPNDTQAEAEANPMDADAHHDEDDGEAEASHLGADPHHDEHDGEAAGSHHDEDDGEAEANHLGADPHHDEHDGEAAGSHNDEEDGEAEANHLGADPHHDEHDGEAAGSHHDEEDGEVEANHLGADPHHDEHDGEAAGSHHDEDDGEAEANHLGADPHHDEDDGEAAGSHHDEEDGEVVPAHKQDATLPVMIHKLWFHESDEKWCGDADADNTPITLLTRAPSTSEHPNLRETSYHPSSDVMRGFREYHKLLEAFDEKLPNTVEKMITRGSLLVDADGPYELGLIGRKCKIAETQRDKKRQEDGEYDASTDGLRVIEDLPDDFWTVPRPFSRHPPPPPPRAEEEQQPRHGVYRGRLKRKRPRRSRQCPDNNQPNQFQVKAILGHRARKSTYLFQVQWEHKDEDGEHEVNWQPYKNLRACVFLLPYIDRANDDKLKKWIKKRRPAQIGEEEEDERAPSRESQREEKKVEPNAVVDEDGRLMAIEFDDDDDDDDEQQ